jgi:hypothetical protein
MLPRLGAKDIVSEVMFSSSTASLSPSADGRHASAASRPNGRKMVLNPLPIQLPVNAVSGPRGAEFKLTGHAVRSGLTSLIENLAGEESAVASPLASVMAHLVSAPWQRASSRNMISQQKGLVAATAQTVAVANFRTRGRRCTGPPLLVANCLRYVI